MRILSSARLGGLVCVTLAALAAGACEQPNSIELGALCKGSAECKAPADTCLTIGTKSTCSMACTKDSPCPDGYACAVTNAKTRTQGMCLPDADVSTSTVLVDTGRKRAR
ncbi:MAG: hypothetical protein AAF721_38230 [Myxococcota bacterium]